MELENYKKALNIIVNRLTYINKKYKNVLVLCQEFEYFIREELPKIIKGLDLKNKE